jgi:hypothetical protein
MSYQLTERTTLVVCDLCEVRGPIGDQNWRVTRCDANGAPLHLCINCRRTAVWCEAHARYHRPSDNHRCACLDCGGLFTTSFFSGVVRCPSCRRAFEAEKQQPVPQPQRHPPQRGWMAMLRSLVSLH